MWNITPEDVERAKQELQGRRAAIQARYEDEVHKLTAELDDIETFERVAAEFALRHKREEVTVTPEPEPEPVMPVLAELEPIAALEALPIVPDVAVEAAEDLDGFDDPADIEIVPKAEPAPIAADTGAVQKASSRWRMRV
jgi:hypothetical protein